MLAHTVPGKDKQLGPITLFMIKWWGHSEIYWAEKVCIEAIFRYAFMNDHYLLLFEKASLIKFKVVCNYLSC